MRAFYSPDNISVDEKEYKRDAVNVKLKNTGARPSSAREFTNHILNDSCSLQHIATSSLTKQGITSMRACDSPDNISVDEKECRRKRIKVKLNLHTLPSEIATAYKVSLAMTLEKERKSPPLVKIATLIAFARND